MSKLLPVAVPVFSSLPSPPFFVVFIPFLPVRFAGRIARRVLPAYLILVIELFVTKNKISK